VSNLSQWLAEAQADATETRLQHERMARALGGIASFASSCEGCRFLSGIAQRALIGIDRYPPKPLNPTTGTLT
jgi:hypothetical protein